MEFSIFGMGGLVHMFARRSECKKLLYAFVISKCTDIENFFRSNVDIYMSAISQSSEGMDVIVPEFRMANFYGKLCSAPEVVEILQSGLFYDRYESKTVDISHMSKAFKEDHISQSKSIAHEFGVTDQLPIIIFINSLEAPQLQQCYFIKIAGKSAAEVKDILGSVSERCTIVGREYFKRHKEIETLNCRKLWDNILSPEIEARKELEKSIMRIEKIKNEAINFPEKIAALKARVHKYSSLGTISYLCKYRQAVFTTTPDVESMAFRLQDLESKLQYANDCVVPDIHSIFSLPQERIAEIEAHNSKEKDALAQCDKTLATLRASIDDFRPTTSDILAPLITTYNIKKVPSSYFRNFKHLSPLDSLIHLNNYFN